MKSTAIFFLCSVCLLFGCAAGQDRVVLLEQQVLETRNRLDLIESHYRENAESSQQNEQGLRDHFAGMRAELDSLTADLQKINGRLDEIEYLLNRESSAPGLKKDGLEEAVRVNSDRIARLEEYVNLEPYVVKKQEPAPVPESATPPAPSEELSEEQLYASAKQAFDRNESEVARQYFETLIRKYPKSKLAGNAQFWIGESFYREKWFEKAILEYQKVIENYPKGNKAQSAMLKQGLAFLMLGDKANGKLILNELIQKHPQSTEANIARTKLKEL